MPPKQPEVDEKISYYQILGKEEVLSCKVKLIQKSFDDEMARKKTIESKATMFIASSGFLGTILIGASNILLEQEDAADWCIILMIICLLVFSIYMVSVIFFSIKALSRSAYYYPNPASIVNIDNKRDLFKQEIEDLVNSICHNKNVTNDKSDYVVLAQKHYKRLMIFVSAFVFILLTMLFIKGVYYR